MTRIEGFVVVENDDYYPVITWLTSSLSNWKMEMSPGEVSFEGDLGAEETFTDPEEDAFNCPFGSSWS